MKQFMPVGIPFYLERGEDGIFSFDLATDRKDFSHVALDCFNFMINNIEEFRKTDGEIFPMQTIINGEHTIMFNGKKYRVDAFIKTDNENYLIEFHGCR